MRDTKDKFDLIEFPPRNVKLYCVHLKQDLTLENILDAVDFLWKYGIDPIEERFLSEYYYYLFLNHRDFKNILLDHDFYHIRRENVFLEVRMIPIEDDHPILKLMGGKEIPFICGMRNNPIEAIKV